MGIKTESDYTKVSFTSPKLLKVLLISGVIFCLFKFNSFHCFCYTLFVTERMTTKAEVNMASFSSSTIKTILASKVSFDTKPLGQSLTSIADS